MTYSVSLINGALEALNEEAISAIDPDNLDEQPGRVIKLIGQYDRVIGRTLKAIGRGGFIGHVELSPVAGTGDWKFPYRFQLPDDGLAFVDPPDGAGLELAVEWVGSAEQEVLRADSDALLQISYVRRCDVDLLAPEIFEALRLNLAAAAAYAITNSRDWADRIENKAMTAIRLARGSLPAATDDMPQRRPRMGQVRFGGNSV